MDSRRLRPAFLAAVVDPAVRARFAALDDLEATLEGMVSAAELEWSGFAIPAEDFVAELARHAAGRADCTANEAIATLRSSDLYLAAACAAGDPAALACLESTVLAQLPPALRQVGLTASSIDEVIQKLRAALLVRTPERPPGIAGYSGRGRLYSFVRSAAVRLAMKDLSRLAPAPLADSALEEIAAPADDPEMTHFKGLYRDEFRTAFMAAMADLSQHERNLLRQHYVDSLTVRELGALHQTHHATAARWVATARRKLFAGTRDRLMARLGLGETGVASIIRLVHSELGLSLVRHLGPAE